MKARYAAAAALVATQTSAQSFSTSGSVSYLTVTYDDCPSASMETMITVTNGITVTYCPECEMGGTPTPTPGYTTVYTTTYLSLCPTGLTPVTHTITESCTGATPTWTPGPDHIPQGFTVTKKACTVCGTATPTVTITEPCGCEAHEGVVTPTAATGWTTGAVRPAAATSAGAAPACNGADCGSNSNASSGGSSPASPGNSPAGSAAPYPTPATGCSGPACRAAASSMPTGVVYGNMSGIVPSTAGASDISSLGFTASLIMAVVVAGFAFAL